MKNILKIGLFVSKILEILHFIAAALVAVVGICSVFAWDALEKILSAGAVENGPYLVTYGFEVNVLDSLGNVDMTLFLLFCIGAVFILALFGFVFRNVYLILRGSEKGSPFCSENINRLKKIGWMVIASPILGVVFHILIGLIAGSQEIEIFVDMNGLVLGILVLCLTQYFVHGAELEKDVDGLL